MGYRICMDARKLNEVTKKNAYPMHKADEILTELQGSEYYSIRDMRSGFWLINVAPEDIEKTACITPKGLYEWLVLPLRHARGGVQAVHDYKHRRYLQKREKNLMREELAKMQKALHIYREHHDSGTARNLLKKADQELKYYVSSEDEVEDPTVRKKRIVTLVMKIQPCYNARWKP